MRDKIRYAVVGLGHIAQIAVLPGFAHADSNSELVGFVSGTQQKLDEVSKMYNVTHVWTYEQYDECLKSGLIDAVFIALPNDMHAEFANKALQAGIHVLCEKPMAPTADDCASMISTAQTAGKKLMIAYRLHFEEANIAAIEAIKASKIGEPRFFTSSFSQQVTDGNIRTEAKHKGGALYDIGVYCINAARYLFQDEPIQVLAASASKANDKRFAEIEEMVAGTLRFPKERLATFTCSMGAADTGWYEVVGTEGSLRLDEAYPYAKGHKLTIKTSESVVEKEFEMRDHFGPEMLYFSDCILRNREPEPSGLEGLIDIQIIRALFESAKKGRAIELDLPRKSHRPSEQQKILQPAVQKPKLVAVEAPSRS